MPLNIKDPITERLICESAAVTGEHLRQAQDSCSLAADILEIGKRCAALPDLDWRTADEILGYDERGLPR